MNANNFQVKRPTFDGISLATSHDSSHQLSQFNNKISIPGKCEHANLDVSHLEPICQIGEGSYGFVNKTIHAPTGHLMAVKWIRSTLNKNEEVAALKDLDVVKKSVECPFIVTFYGAVFHEGSCLICMELMDCSLEEFYKIVHHHLKTSIPESILGKIVVATISALDYLKSKLKVIHRDIKPSNILIDRRGAVKLCDFGISGQLIDSIAQSRDAGCRPYMAPERIKLSSPGYDSRSDIWSFGITMIEIATGRFPYSQWRSAFDQIQCVVVGEPPRLPTNDPDYTFSETFQQFISSCLQKEVEQRPKYPALMQMDFFVKSQSEKVNIDEYFSKILDCIPHEITVKKFVETNCKDVYFTDLV